MKIKLTLTSGKEIVTSSEIENMEEWIKNIKPDWNKFGHQYINASNIESIVEIRTYK